MKLGFTFSTKYCRDLGLEWRDALEGLLSLYDWEYVRLPVYWDEIECERGVYDFSDVLEQIQILSRAGMKIVPVIGYRNPRWPERHGPKWLESVGSEEFEKCLFDWVERCVKALRAYESIVVWQVENEPFENDWGDDGFDVRNTYEKELALVKKLDEHNRPCMVTYGYKPWRKTFQKKMLCEDIVGLDIYFRAAFRMKGVRVVLSQFILPFARWRLRRDLRFVAEQGKEVWATEFQAEPWDCIDGALRDESLWKQTISAEQLHRSLKWMEDVGIDTVFLWGVEWWMTLGEEDRREFLRGLSKKNVIE